MDDESLDGLVAFARGPARYVHPAYNPDLVSRVTGLDCTGDEDQAKQEFKEECDINTLVRRFHLGGELPTGVRMPSYGDFMGLEDYHQAATAIAEANQSFAAMPAELRKRFGNDPAAFVEFCEDPGNLEEARRMGLVPPAELAAEEEAESVRNVVAPAPAPASSPAPAKPGGTLAT